MFKNQILIILSDGFKSLKIDEIKNIFNYEDEYFLIDAVFIKKFRDGEISVNLRSLNLKLDFRRVSRAVIFSSLFESVNENIMENLFIIDTLKNHGVKNIKLIHFYLPYMRQDRVLSPYVKLNNIYIQNLESLSSKFVINLFESAGLNEMVILDPHFPQIQGFFSNKMQIKILSSEFLIKYIMLSILKIYFFTKGISESNQLILMRSISEICSRIFLAKYFSQKLDFVDFNDDKDFVKEFKLFRDFLFNEFVFISPDAGALKKIRSVLFLIEELFSFILTSQDSLEEKLNICFIEKIRSGPASSSAVSINGYISGFKYALILDDIIDSGSTLISAAKMIKKNSSLFSISAFITHPILSSNAIENIDSSDLDFLFTTNSISRHKGKLSDKFVFYDVLDWNLIYF